MQGIAALVSNTPCKNLRGCVGMRSFAVLLLLLLTTAAQATELYVAPNGNDRNPGTKAKPFATLERARDVLRLMKRGPGATTIWIRGGVYQLDKTFTLEAGDGGREDAPIVYRACEGETVRITGGRRIKDWKPVTDRAVLARLPAEARGRVLQADLKALGITDYGKLTPRGFGRPVTPAHMELFFDDKPMELARYPNDDWMKIADVPAGKDGGKFTFDGDRPARWAAADDIWIHGYWTWDWAESYEKVKSIDLRTKEIVTEPPHGVYGYKKGARWYALNVLAELDQPCEWYLDRQAGILYFWPPEPIDRSEAWVSILEAPFISLKDTTHVTIRGISFECARGHGVTITGGEKNLLAGCSFRNIGNVGVVIDGGTANGVLSSDISETGDGGVKLSGGDRKTLTPAGNYVRNCHIHHYNRWVRTYRPAVLIQGVGNVIANNHIHDSPHCAILLNGNEHVIEYNDIHRVCRETGDAGAFYLGRDWTERGNVVRFNYFHHLDKPEGITNAWSEVMAVYLDDWASGTRVFGNVFYKAGRAAMIGGGRNNTISNNIFVDCDPSVHVDARGLQWGAYYFDGSNTTLTDRLKAMNYTQPPYSERYPELLSLYDDEPAVPKYNAIERNIVFGGRWITLSGLNDKTVLISDNMIDIDPGFVDLLGGDLRLRDDSPAWKLGFKRIPMEEIGMRNDEYRKSERTALPPERPQIRKLGTTVCDLVEATPVVFKGSLYRFEYVRDQYYKPNLGKPSYFRFVDMKTGEETPGFAQGYHLGSAFVDGDTAYAFGVNKWDGEEIRVFWSKDLKTWESKTALNLPGWGIFNTAVCKGQHGYVMAFEIGRPPEETGSPFTIRFAESKDCRTWKLTDSKCVYSKDRYTACPAIRYLNGWYYMIYLEAYPGPAYNPHIVRSNDLVTWESSKLNPVLRYSIEDKLIANPNLTQEERERIAGAVNINNSDVDFCEFEGKTHIVYSWGNQQGIEHLAEAVYDGPEPEFLESFFAE